MTYFPGKWNKMWGRNQGEVYSVAFIISNYFSLFHILHNADTVETGLQIQLTVNSGINVSVHQKENLSIVGIVTYTNKKYSTITCLNRKSDYELNGEVISKSPFFFSFEGERGNENYLADQPKYKTFYIVHTFLNFI